MTKLSHSLQLIANEADMRGARALERYRHSATGFKAFTALLDLYRIIRAS